MRTLPGGYINGSLQARTTTDGELAMTIYVTTNAEDLIGLWRTTYDAHDHTGGFMRCKTECTEGFPCATRIQAARALTELGVRLYSKMDYLRPAVPVGSVVRQVLPQM